MTEAFSAVECNACFVKGFKVFLEKIKGEFPECEFLGGSVI